jgi:hypothetical protein
LPDFAESDAHTSGRKIAPNVFDEDPHPLFEQRLSQACSLLVGDR